MKCIEQFPTEQLDQTAIDTQQEVDLLCGGVGFDDDSADDRQRLIEAREKQKAKIENKEG